MAAQSPRRERQALAPDESALAEPSAHDQLTRILASDTFQQSDQLKRFLTFVVTEATAGREGDLKEYVIGVHVFRKEESFDPRTDPIVRVQARRLRMKLARYYKDEGRGDALIIDLPKGGYAPVFRLRQEPILNRNVGTVLTSRNTIIVERFADHSRAHDLEYFCSAVHEELIHRLARLPGVRIFAADDTETRVDPGVETPGAALVIRGSVRQAGERLRTTVHLLDATNGCYLWSESIDTGESETFEAQERVAVAVIEKIEPDWRKGRGVGTIGGPARNLAAENLYLQGRYHLNQRTEEGLGKAVEFFDRALAEGALFAPAHSGLADAYSLLAHYGVLAPAEAWPKAAAGATTAVMLDDLSAEAHTSLALVKVTQDLDWAGAEREYRRAMGLDPRYATAHHWYAATTLAPLGRLDEALETMLTAQSLDPVSSIVSRDVAMMHLYKRDFEAALEFCDHTIELNPHFGPAYWALGVIQAQRRDFDESIAALQRAVHLLPNSPRMYGALGRTFALAGREKRAQEMLRKIESLARHRYVSPLDFAWVLLALGDEAMGFRWLAKACADRSFELFAIKIDPRFDPYHSDPRFVQIIRKLKLDEASLVA